MVYKTIKTKTMKQFLIVIVLWELAKFVIRTSFDKIVNK